MSAIAFNPLVDYGVSAPDPGPPPTDSNAGATRGAGMGPSPVQVANAADLQGIPPYTGAHNTPLQVAFLGLVALAVVILLRKLGFGFAVAGRLSAGRG